MNAGQDLTKASMQSEQAEELHPGTSLLQGQYVVERFLNAGGFGMTYLARDSLDRRMVLKECFPNSMCCRDRADVRARNRSSQREFEAVVRLFGHEARRLAALKHPNIVGIHQVFEANGTAYMALDFVRGRELLDIIEDENVELTANQVKFILRKVLRAVQYIHENDVLHRDISPDNILIQPNGNPVLIDFGAAREEASKASRALSHIHVVKDGYSPQEFYIQGSEQDPSSDLYSLAATFYHLISGTAPPTSQKRVAAIAAGKEDPYRPLINHVRSFDEHFLGAIDQAMSPFPKDRLRSADAWLERIDTVRRQKAALEKARKDSQIEASIQALVAATNSDMLDEVDLTKPRLSREIARKSAPDAVTTNKDATVPNKDVVATNEDMVATNKDVVATNKDVVATNEDMVATNKDVIATNKDVIVTSKIDRRDAEASQTARRSIFARLFSRNRLPPTNDGPTTDPRH